MNPIEKSSRDLKPRQRPDYDLTSGDDIDEEEDSPAEPGATAIEAGPRREAEPENRRHPRVPIEPRSHADRNPEPLSGVTGAISETRKLQDLKSHPDQARYFTDLSDHDLAILAQDIRDHGLKLPIEILPANQAGFPANTILKGHQRKRALELIGRTEVDVLVRHDLAQVDPPTIEREFLNDNLNRRQLDVLGKARVSLRLYEIEKKRPRDQLGKEDEKEARARIGKTIGMSGRHLDRYFRILRTPPEVQKAFQDGRLRLIDAEKVARLNPARQAQLACEMTGTQDLKALLRSYFPGRNQPPGKAESLSDLLKCFENGLEGLARHAGPGALTNKDRASYREALKKAQKQIEALLAGVSG